MRILLVLILLPAQFLIAQNLVPNGDFEEYSRLPNDLGQYFLATGWSNLNGNTTNGNGSPDYYHILATVPDNYGAIDPFSGGGQIAFLTYVGWLRNGREYISIQLSSALLPGKKYHVSFFLSNGIGKSHGSNNIGTYFSLIQPIQQTYEPLSVNPQIEITDVIYHYNYWQNYTFTFTADQAYKYITIGNFRNDAHTQIDNNGSPDYFDSYFFIDRIEITPFNPNLQISGPNRICQGETTKLIASKGDSYAWAERSDLSVVISTDSVISVSPPTTTTYFVYSSEDTASFTVNVIPLPSSKSTKDTAICKDQLLLLDTTYPNAGYLWQDGDTNAIRMVTQPGDYWVQITSNKCSVTDTFHIMEEDCEVILDLPNLITPNNDGMNDLFTPIFTKGITAMRTSIYNRWGQKVFSTEDPLINWDVSHVPDGIYYWSIEYFGKLDRRFTKKGWVQVER